MSTTLKVIEVVAVGVGLLAVVISQIHILPSSIEKPNPSASPVSNAARGMENTINALVADLRDEGKGPDAYFRRKHAAQVLGNYGAAGVPAITALMAALDDTRIWWHPNAYLVVDGRVNNSSIADDAKYSLIKLLPLANGYGLDYATRALFSQEANEHPSDKMGLVSLVSVLPGFGERALPILVRLFHSDRATSLPVVLEALSKFGRVTLPTLSEALKHQDPAVRESAAEILGKGDLTCSKDIVDLMAARPDPGATDRPYCAAVRLKWSKTHAGGYPEAVPWLIEALGDKNFKVRRSTAWALGHIADTRATIPLENALRAEEDESARRNEADALAKIKDLEVRARCFDRLPIQSCGVN